MSIKSALSILLLLLALSTGPFNSCLADPPADLKASISRVNELVGARDYEAALPVSERAVAKFPQNYEARVQRGLVYMGLEEDEKAVVDFQWALHMKPKDHLVASDLASAYSSMNDQKSALKYVDISIANCPQQAGYLAACYDLKKEILRRMERYDEAEKALSKALRLDSGDPHWFLERLKLRLKISQWQGAIDDASHCLPVMPNFKEQILQMRAKAYVGMKRYSEAERDLNEALKLDPDELSLHKDRYLVYQLTGKKDLAEKEHKLIENLEKHDI